MATATQLSKGTVLNSWKEIAQYLGRGVRTVQRYENDLDLPVRRPRGKSRSAVIAIPDELDAWIRTAPRTAPHKEASSVSVHSVDVDLPKISQVIQQGKELRTRTTQLRADHARVLEVLVKTVEAISQANVGLLSVSE